MVGKPATVSSSTPTKSSTMSSTAKDAELSSKGRLLRNSNTADKDTLSASKELNIGHEIVWQLENLELAPVPAASTFKFGGTNECGQLCGRTLVYDGCIDLDCGLPYLLRRFGDPLPYAILDCYCANDEAHTCWLTSESCGTRGKNSDRRRKIAQALHEAVDALEKVLLCMYRDHTILDSYSQPYARQRAGLLTRGLYEVATRRLASLTLGVEQFQQFHKPNIHTSPDKLEPSNNSSEGGTYEDGSDDQDSVGSEEDLVGLQQRLSACRTNLLKPLQQLFNTNESMIKASEDFELAVRTYENAGNRPMHGFREYYMRCVVRVADGMPKLDHYHEHPSCEGLANHLRGIDEGYRCAHSHLQASWQLYQFYNSTKMSEILWSIWDEARSHFERPISFTRVERPDDLGWEYDDKLSCSGNLHLIIEENWEDDDW